MTWFRRAAIACGVLGPMVCAGALADDPVDDALSLVAQERNAEAREAIEQMLERNPEAPGVRLLQGVLYAREGNLVEAVAVFESLRDDHPTMFEAHNNLAVLYAKLGRLDDARKALIATLELRSDAVIYANLGDVYMKLAERAYERAHELRIEQDVVAVGSVEADAASQPETAPVEPPVAEPVEEEEDIEVLAAVPAEPEIVEEPASPEAPAVAEEPESPEGPEVVEDTGSPEAPMVAEEPEVPEAPEVVEEPEVPAEPGPEEPEETVAQAPGESCIKAGWFENSEAAYDAAAWMRSRGATEIQVRSEEHQIIKNYQVYLPPTGSREAARALARELRDKGVEDLWIIDRGTQINGVSLGVYRNKRYMTRRVAELEALGYTVVTTANMRTATGYAVYAQAGGERVAFDEDWKKAFPEHEIRGIDCADRT